MGNVMTAGKPLPASAYFEANIFESEITNLFSRVWLPVGRSDEIPTPGSFFTWDRTRVPFVLMRSVDGTVRGFYNSCRHRGAPVVRTPVGRARAFRCQYHSWTYDTFGKLMAVPDERDFGEVNRCAYSLVPLDTEELNGWLWVRQKKEGPALIEEAGQLATALNRFGDAARFHDRQTFMLHANWKAAVERLAELPIGKDSIWHLPNVAVSERDDLVRLIALWPLDERTTTLEIVRCTNGDRDLGDDAALQAELTSALDGLERSGVSLPDQNPVAARLAQTLFDTVDLRPSTAHRA